MPNTLQELIPFFSLAIIACSIVVAIVKGSHYILTSNIRKREEYLQSFNSVVSQLSSDNQSSQLAAAVLLRRYFDINNKMHDIKLRTEAVNVISALLKVLRVGVFQKTLGDGLAYATDLSKADLQKVNLQNVYLGKDSEEQKIIMFKTDLFMADLSYALLENIDGKEAIFYNAILFNTQIKNCNFSCANFAGADLKNASFTNVILNGAKFKDAINVPSEITKVLKDGVVDCKDEITAKAPEPKGEIFFSMPGCISKREEALTKTYKEILESWGYSVCYYMKDDYPEYGQFSRVRESIGRSSAIIAFGFKQMCVEKGTVLPGTAKEKQLTDKWFNTPWNEVEVGMALMRGIPILLVKDEGIDSGIFDKKLSEHFIGSISTEFDSRKIETNPVFVEWCNQIK